MALAMASEQATVISNTRSSGKPPSAAILAKKRLPAATSARLG